MTRKIITFEPLRRELRLYKEAYSQKDLVSAEASYALKFATKMATISFGMVSSLYILSVIHFNGWADVANIDWSGIDGSIVRHLFFGTWAILSVFTGVVLSTQARSSPIGEWVCEKLSAERKARRVQNIKDAYNG